MISRVTYVTCQHDKKKFIFFAFFQDEIRLADINEDVGGRYSYSPCLLQGVYDYGKENCK